MDRKLSSAPPKDGKKKAPAFQSTALGAPANVVPKQMSPSDMLRLAELGILQSKDSPVEQELQGDLAPTSRDLATAEDDGRGQKRTVPNQTTTDRRPAPPSQKPSPFPTSTTMDWRLVPPPLEKFSPVATSKTMDWRLVPPPLEKPGPVSTSTTMDHVPSPPKRDPIPPPTTLKPAPRPMCSKNILPPVQRSPPDRVTRVINRLDGFQYHDLEPVHPSVYQTTTTKDSIPPPLHRDAPDLRFNPPPPRRLPGDAKPAASRPAPRDFNSLWDSLEQEEALKSKDGHVEQSKSGEQPKDALPHPAESKVYNTWEHYLQDLKPAWNGSRRLAIDVPGDGIESHRLAEGTSWPNETEARLICDLVKGAIEAEVPANGVALTCANFLGVVFYEAQGGVISEKMFRFRINKPGKRVMVESTNTVQGAEGDIVLLSFARNIPDKPFDVTLARAKQSTVVVGDIRAWCQERIDEDRLITSFGKSAKPSHFGTYIQDIIEKKDGISYGDVQRFLNGEDVKEAEFPKLLKPKLDGMKSTGRGRATAEPKAELPKLSKSELDGMKSDRRDRIREVRNDAFGRLERQSRIERRAEEEAIERRRMENLRNASK